MKTTTRLQVAAVTVVTLATLALTAAVGSYTVPRATATVALPQIVITGQRLPVQQLSAVIVTGKRQHTHTRIAAATATNVAL